MALVTASGTLTTPDWAEFGTVAFTTSTLATLSSCIDEVGRKVNRTLSATDEPTHGSIANWLNRAKMEIAQERGYSFERRYVTATGTTGTYRYALPEDFETATKLRDLTNDAPIRIIDPHQFDMLYPDLSGVTNGQVLVACVKNMELWMAPAPDGSDVFELEYERSGAYDSTDFSWLPELQRFRCVDIAVKETYESLKDFEWVLYYQNKQDRGERKTKRVEGRRKLRQTNYRARSIFQA